MSPLKTLLHSLLNDPDWFITGDHLTLVKDAAMFMVRLDGRTFVMNPPVHNGEWRWWIWQRRRVARAARALHAQLVAKTQASTGGGN